MGLCVCECIVCVGMSKIKFFGKLPVDALQGRDFFHLGRELNCQIFDQLLHLVLVGGSSGEDRFVILDLSDRFIENPVPLNLRLQFIRVFLDYVLILHDLIQFKLHVLLHRDILISK